MFCRVYAAKRIVLTRLRQTNLYIIPQLAINLLGINIFLLANTKRCITVLLIQHWTRPRVCWLVHCQLTLSQCYINPALD